MPQNEDRDFRYERLENSLRLCRVALLVCLVLLLVLLGVLLTGRRRVARAISLDGQIAVLVANQETAERVRASLLEPARRSSGGGVCGARGEHSAQSAGRFGRRPGL